MLTRSPTTRTTLTGWRPPVEPPFLWHVYDVAAELPEGWDTDLLEVAARHAARRYFRPTMSTAREATDDLIPIEAVDGERLTAELPWTDELYRGWFRRLARRLTHDDLHTTTTANRALSLNLLRHDGGRYPCHVDSNPMQGLLYLTDTDPQTGGGLIVARNRNARSTAEVDADATVLYPRRGHLYFFDARFHAHYVEPLHKPAALRAVLTMNYYSPSCPEDSRPAGLDQELFGP